MFFDRAYKTPAAASTAQPIPTAARKRLFSAGLVIALILTSVFPAFAQDAPENLAKLVGRGESETEAERNEYMYRQTIALEELGDHGAMRRRYREVRDIIFSPKKERPERLVGKPDRSLKSLILPPEDFPDIRDIQPLVLTEELLPNYETKFRGERSEERR